MPYPSWCTAALRSIHWINQTIGALVCWFCLLMAVLVAGIVILRTCCEIGSIAAQELVTYFHASLFMLAMAYTAIEKGHVRVDIFYTKMSGTQKAWIDLLGACVFLLPFAVFLTAITWHSMAQSWAIREGSLNSEGIPALFLLKTLMPLTGGLLILHAFSEILQKLSVVSFELNDMTQGGR